MQGAGARVKTTTPAAARQAKRPDKKKATPAQPALATAAKAASQAAVPPRLLKHFREQVVPSLMKQFGYTNPLQVPHLAKIVINMGVGEAARDAKFLDEALMTLTVISGQKPVTTQIGRAREGK